MLKKREKRAKQRIANAQRAAGLADVFFDKGFTTLEAMVAIVTDYYPELTSAEIKNFWHFRNVSELLLDKIDNVLGQIKNE